MYVMGLDGHLSCACATVKGAAEFEQETLQNVIEARAKVGQVNFDTAPQEIAHGERIAQMLISKVLRIEWEVSETLPESGRGTGGFGSTGRH